MSYWITYVLLPVAAGIGSQVSVRRRRKRGTAAGLAPAAFTAVAGMALIACAAKTGMDLVDIVTELNLRGRGIFATVLVAQLGLGTVLVSEARSTHRDHFPRARKRLGILAIMTGLTMLCVRAQFIQIFG